MPTENFGGSSWFSSTAEASWDGVHGGHVGTAVRNPGARHWYTKESTGTDSRYPGSVAFSVALRVLRALRVNAATTRGAADR